jgi:M6 family metalloprotease-like protein
MKRICLLVSVWSLFLADLQAQEFFCAGFSSELQTTIAAKSAAISGTSGRPIRVLVIFTQFKNEIYRPIPAYADRIFDPELPGSFTHFYRTMSSGQLDAQGTVLPKRYTSTQTAAYYMASTTGLQPPYGSFAQDILTQVDRDIDFGRFDNDGPDGIPNSGDDNGFVDYIFIAMPSVPKGFISGGATGVAGLRLNSVAFKTNDSRRDNRIIQITGATSYGSLLQEGRFDQTVGSMAHEYGHALGLPDLYDTDYNSPSTDSGGIGNWGLMGWGAHGWQWTDGPAALSAWSLETLGWIGVNNSRLIDVAGDVSGLSISDVHTNGFVYRVPLGIGSKDGINFAEEYLLLEQRTRTYYNSNIPAEGLLVWHIRPQATNNKEENYKLVSLVTADGRYQDAGYPLGLQTDGVTGMDNLDYWSHDAKYTADHGGNLGDASDPFDGVRFTRLNMQSNPSSNLLQVQSEAFTGLALSMRRQGRTVIVDIRQPRWAGTIAENLHWAGPVLVDGDLRIAPGGALTIHGNTRVLFAGADRLQMGTDPARTELVIEGDFSVHLSNSTQQVQFDAVDPLQPWYGILVQPTSTSKIEVLDKSLAVFNTTHGIQFPNVLPVNQNRLVSSFQLVDAFEHETAGNGDGRLNPGETFLLGMSLSNWSLNAHKNMNIQLQWDSPLVSPAWQASQSLRKQALASDVFSLSPGGTQDLQLPVLTLSPTAKLGDVITIHASGQTVFGQVFHDSLIYVVDGVPLRFEAAWDIPGKTIYNQTAVVQSGWPTSYKARVTGQIAAVDLVVRSLADSAIVAEIPMAPRSGNGTEQIFQAAFMPRKAGAYRAYLRLRGIDGTARFAEATLGLWATPRGSMAPVLVFIGDQYDDEGKSRISQTIARQLGPFGLTSQTLNISSQEDAVYRSLLPYYASDDKLVIWLGSRLNTEEQNTFRTFLAGGGRLMLISYGLEQSPDIRPFMREVVYTDRLRRGRSRLLPISSEDLSNPLLFSALHVPLNPLAPAEVLLRNNRDQVAGLRLDTGTYRLVYLPFDLPVQEGDAVQALLGAGIRFLQQQDLVAGGKYAEAEEGKSNQLLSNFPNPFNAQTTIAYRLSGPATVKLTLFNAMGQIVKRLVNETQAKGEHTVIWNGTDAANRPLGSGMYFYTLDTGAVQETRRLLLLK